MKHFEEVSKNYEKNYHLVELVEKLKSTLGNQTKYRTDALGLKIIHWEYEKSNEPIENIENYMRIQHVVKPGTKIKNGLLFRSIVKIHTKSGVKLNCIGEEVLEFSGPSSF